MFERFTERARQVVVLAQDEARALKHNYIGTEHILLGIARENGGVAARILERYDADPEKIRNEIIRMLSGPGRRAKVEPPSWEQQAAAMDGEKLWDAYQALSQEWWKRFREHNKKAA